MTTLSHVRDDARPEYAVWRDTGCVVAPRCLECPLPVCRYDLHAGVRGSQSIARQAEIARMRAEGLSVESIGERLGISRRSVFRLLGKTTKK